MKLISLLSLLFIYSCAPNPENANRGAQSSQDYPSNPNGKLEDSDVPHHKDTVLPAPKDSNGVYSVPPQVPDSVK